MNIVEMYRKIDDIKIHNVGERSVEELKESIEEILKLLEFILGNIVSLDEKIDEHCDWSSN